MRSFQELVTSNRRAISILGAAIVFLTFIIKEGFREKVKDDLSRVTTAEAQYRAQSNHEEVMRAIRTSTGIADPDAPVIEDLAPPPKTEAQEWAKAQPFLDIRLSKYVEDADLLRHDKEDAPELAGARRRAMASLENLAAIQRETDSVFNSGNNINKRLKANGLEFGLAESLRENWMYANAAVRDYALSSIRITTRDQVRNERLLKVFDNCSYFLFALGWGLGLLGRLHDGGEGTPEVEG